MEPGFLDVVPVRAKHGAPLGAQIRVLRHHVFDRELGGVDAFFAEVLEAVKEVEAVPHVVHVACFEGFAELVVGWESSFLALSVERDLEAGEWLLFLDAVGKAREYLAEAARLEVAYTSPKYVAFQEFDGLDEL